MRFPRNFAKSFKKSIQKNSCEQMLLQILFKVKSCYKLHNLVVYMYRPLSKVPSRVILFNSKRILKKENHSKFHGVLSSPDRGKGLQGN